MHEQSKLMSATELADYLGTTRNAAYTLLHRADFPTVKIGNLLYAIRDQIDPWIQDQAKKGGYIYGQETWTR